MRLGRLSALLTLLGLSPAQTLSGLTFDGDDVVSLEWTFDGQSTGRYDFYLCAGDESTGSYEYLERVITDETVVPGELLSFRVDRSVGGNDPNAYFLKVIPANQEEKWVGFTSHFTLTNMKGSFSSKVSDAINSMQPISLQMKLSNDAQIEASEEDGSDNISNPNIDIIKAETTQPLPQVATPSPSSELDSEHFELRKRLLGAGVGAGVGVGVNAHEVPYGEQTGPTKYAPTPKKAGSTIPPLGVTPTPQYPPFPFVKATTYLGAPTVETTQSVYLTSSITSIENTAAPAPAPTLDKRMQDWLESQQN